MQHLPQLDVMRGLYAKALTNWRQHWPRKQILVLNFAQLVGHATKQDVLTLIGDFVGSTPLGGLPSMNTAGGEA